MTQLGRWLEPLVGSYFATGAAVGGLATVTARLAKVKAPVTLGPALAVAAAVSTPVLALAASVAVGLGCLRARQRRLLAPAVAAVTAWGLRLEGLAILPLAVAAATAVVRDARPSVDRLTWARAVVVAAAIYATVPDTEHALALLGFTVAVAVLVALDDHGHALSPGYAFLAGCVVALGGSPRPSALVGGSASLALLALVASPGPAGFAVLCGCALVTSRVAGLAATSAGALRIAVPALLAAWGCDRWLSRRGRRRRLPPGASPAPDQPVRTPR